jgi:hypothetical protein
MHGTIISDPAGSMGSLPFLFALALGLQNVQPDLTAVLARAGAYVTRFYEQLSGIVAEEEYVQTWRRTTTTFFGGHSIENTDRTRTRRLRSDLALVHPIGSNEWLQFRDVFEVDGGAVTDRSERLTKLFLESSDGASEQAARIRRESARYNLGDIARNVNTPLLALKILVPSEQHRFRFKRTAKRQADTVKLAPDHAGVFRVSTEVWVIEYDEVSHPTLIRTGVPVADKDIEAHGRFWIEPDTGRVIMTELRARDGHVSGLIDVSYQSEPLLSLLVPVEMREEYSNDAGSHITGIATYGKFRQFQVNVDEKFLIKK